MNAGTIKVLTFILINDIHFSLSCCESSCVGGKNLNEYARCCKFFYFILTFKHACHMFQDFNHV